MPVFASGDKCLKGLEQTGRTNFGTQRRRDAVFTRLWLATFSLVFERPDNRAAYFRQLARRKLHGSSRSRIPLWAVLAAGATRRGTSSYVRAGSIVDAAFLASSTRSGSVFSSPICAVAGAGWLSVRRDGSGWLWTFGTNSGGRTIVCSGGCPGWYSRCDWPRSTGAGRIDCSSGNSLDVCIHGIGAKSGCGTLNFCPRGTSHADLSESNRAAAVGPHTAKGPVAPASGGLAAVISSIR